MFYVSILLQKAREMKQISEEEFKVKVLSRLNAIVIALAVSAFSIVMSFAMFILQNYHYITQLLPSLLSGLVAAVVIFYIALRK